MNNIYFADGIISVLDENTVNSPLLAKEKEKYVEIIYSKNVSTDLQIFVEVLRKNF